MPWKFGVDPLQPDTQPGLSPLSSIASFASRPKVGVPQTEMLSFVLNGPSMLSVEMKSGSEQLVLRWGRYLSAQFVAAQVGVCVPELLYAYGSRVSKFVK